MEARQGNWIQTFLGNRFFPMDPRPSDFRIEDIAHALSNLCRYAGHCKSFYSVAQHSVIVSEEVGKTFDRWTMEGLLHDASEAYLVDVPRPVKHDPALAGYRQIEKVMESVIAEAFNLTYPWPDIVKLYDDAVLMTERRDLMATPPIPWTTEHHEPLKRKIIPWSPKKAEQEFLKRYDDLRSKLNQKGNDGA